VKCWILLKFCTLVRYESSTAPQWFKSTYVEIMTAGDPQMMSVVNRYVGGGMFEQLRANTLQTFMVRQWVEVQCETNASRTRLRSKIDAEFRTFQPSEM